MGESMLNNMSVPFRADITSPDVQDAHSTLNELCHEEDGGLLDHDHMFFSLQS